MLMGPAAGASLRCTLRGVEEGTLPPALNIWSQALGLTFTMFAKLRCLHVWAVPGKKKN